MALTSSGGGNARRWRVEGLDELLNKLDKEPIFARPWRAAMYAAVKLGAAVGRERAPVGKSGRLRQRMRFRIQRGKVPLWGIVSNSASRKGFRYGFALDYGYGRRKRSGLVYRFYRRDNLQPTEGWFLGILPKIQNEVNGLLVKAAREIEAAWQR